MMTERDPGLIAIEQRLLQDGWETASAYLVDTRLTVECSREGYTDRLTKYPVTSPVPEALADLISLLCASVWKRHRAMAAEVSE